MASLRAPGSLGRSAFGISFDRDRQRRHGGSRTDRGFEASCSENPDPEARRRRELLWCVEQSGATVAVEGGGGGVGGGIPTLAWLPLSLVNRGWARGGLHVAVCVARRAEAIALADLVGGELARAPGGGPTGGREGYSSGYGAIASSASGVGESRAGFSVEYLSSRSASTEVLFLAEGMMLREISADPLLRCYSVIVVDLAHARPLEADLTLGLLRKIRKRRPGLRVVVVAGEAAEGRELATFFGLSRGLPSEGSTKEDGDGGRRPAGGSQRDEGDGRETKHERSRRDERDASERRERSRRDERGTSERRERSRRDERGTSERRERSRRDERDASEGRERSRRDERGTSERRGSRWDTAPDRPEVPLFPAPGDRPPPALPLALATLPRSPFPPPETAATLLPLSPELASDVTVRYLSEPTSDYLSKSVEVAANLHALDEFGDVLVLLTSGAECERAAQMLADEVTADGGELEGGPGAGAQGGRKRSYLETGGSRYRRLRLATRVLAGRVSPESRAEALAPAPRGSRKVVFATWRGAAGGAADPPPAAPPPRLVVDAALARLRVSDPVTGLAASVVAPVSRPEALRRAALAGRGGLPGRCFRLLTRADASRLLPEREPSELELGDLARPLLTLQGMGVRDALRFDWPRRPSAAAVVRGLETLHALGAVGDDGALTEPLGTRMAALGLEPALSRALLAGAEAGCAEEVSAAVAVLAVGGEGGSAIWLPPGERHRADPPARRGGDPGLGPGPRGPAARFAAREGDLCSYLNVVRAWEASGRSKGWCRDLGLNHGVLVRAALARRDMLRAIADVPRGEPPASSAGLLRAVLMSLAAGLCLNAAKIRDEEGGGEEDLRRGVTGGGRSRRSGPAYDLLRPTLADPAPTLAIHPSSVLHGCDDPPPYVLFASAEALDGGPHEMRGLLAIEPTWLAEVAPHVYMLRGGGGARTP